MIGYCLLIADKGTEGMASSSRTDSEGRAEET